MSTISSAVKADMQAAFDKATAAVIKQGVRSVTSTGQCLYRCDTLRCAVGHLVSDEQIDKYQINNGAAASCFTDDLIKEIVPSASLQYEITIARQFLCTLQVAHDLPTGADTFVEGFKYRANEVAGQYDLNPIR